MFAEKKKLEDINVIIKLDVFLMFFFQTGNQYPSKSYICRISQIFQLVNASKFQLELMLVIPAKKKPHRFFFLASYCSKTARINKTS